MFLCWEQDHKSLIDCFGMRQTQSVDLLPGVATLVNIFGVEIIKYFSNCNCLCIVFRV